MLEIKLNDYGVDDVLQEICRYLESAIKSKSKKQKNETMNKALGAIDTLYYLINITDASTNEETEHEA